jgi:phosphoheptose isomerase
MIAAALLSGGNNYSFADLFARQVQAYGRRVEEQLASETSSLRKLFLKGTAFTAVTIELSALLLQPGLAMAPHHWSSAVVSHSSQNTD